MNPPPVNMPLIRVEGVNFSRDGKLILTDIHLNLFENEIVTILGPNGAGKTSLLKILIKSIRPDSGIVIHKNNLSIGYAPQNLDIIPMMPLRVVDFLHLALPRKLILNNKIRKANQDMIYANLEKLAIAHCFDRQVSSLSGGEYQRVLLARALLRRPDILILDEPTKGLDTHGQAHFYDLIVRIRNEMKITILMVSHDLHVVMRASDRVLCLHNHICCEGTPLQISQNAAYLELLDPTKSKTMALYTHDHDHDHNLGGSS